MPEAFGFPGLGERGCRAAEYKRRVAGTPGRDVLPGVFRFRGRMGNNGRGRRGWRGKKE
jgi:hypothetical protein